MTREFAAFVLVGGAAALVNFVSRIKLSLFMPYAVAIVVAYVIGMVVAFELNRHVVFRGAHEGARTKQAPRFVVVNLAGVLLTLGVSLLLARLVFPAAGMSWYPETVAHAFGIAAPVLTSYLAHKYWTYR